MNIKDSIRERLGGKILHWQEPGSRRVYLAIDKGAILEAARFFFEELRMRFTTASAADTAQGLEILYHFSFDQAGEFYTLRVLLEDKASPEIDSLAPLFPGAEWIER